MPVGVLESLAGQRRTARRRADDEPAGHLIGRRPEAVAGALETEHRIEDVQRDHRLVVRCIRRADSSERRRRSGLVDALVQDLTFWALPVGEHQVGVDRGVELAERVVDLQCREPGVHPERTRLIRDDRHDSATDLFVAQQIFENADQCHRGGDLLLARSLGHRLQHPSGIGLECLRRCVSVGHEPAERVSSLDHVLDLGCVGSRRVVRRQVGIGFECFVADRDLGVVAERLEIVEGQLLHLVGGVTALEVRTERVALDGVREDDGRLTLVRHRCRVSGVHLAVVVSAAVEIPDLIVGPVFD